MGKEPWELRDGKRFEPVRADMTDAPGNGRDRMQENWEELANAIITEAVNDYRWARKKVRTRPDQKTAQAAIRDTERFFRSRWFAQLTQADGEQLLDKLRREAVI